MVRRNGIHGQVRKTQGGGFEQDQARGIAHHAHLHRHDTEDEGRHTQESAEQGSREGVRQNHRQGFGERVSNVHGSVEAGEGRVGQVGTDAPSPTTAAAATRHRRGSGKNERGRGRNDARRASNDGRERSASQQGGIAPPLQPHRPIQDQARHEDARQLARGSREGQAVHLRASPRRPQRDSRGGQVGQRRTREQDEVHSHRREHQSETATGADTAISDGSVG
mmetsp:Transcript_18413/g.38545  ORF Transcript_18413/g.38545 Transcript_18413/m.38545 type:complete len:223 (-) Transcript_18413:37-705(-)